MRFLLDTGASASFINPEYIPHGELLHCDPVTITTVFKKYQLKTQTNVKIFKEFNQDGLLKFLIFKFHNFFDGLLGLDTLLQLNAKIDLENKILVTKNSVVEIHFKPNESSDVLNVPAQSKILAKLPVNKLDGDIILNTIELKPDVFISQGIYRAINGYSTVEITNYSESDENILLEESLQSTEYQPEEYLELNNLHITPEEEKTTERKNIEHLLRTDHLNREEKNQLLKLCKRYNDIIYIEGEQLTFSNQIKHTINTTDDVPIYMKSYRYPYIHKQEVQDQISKMLEQGIIRQSYSPWSSPVWIVPKKSDASGKQKWRLVIDYRKVNEKTVSDRYPIPNITEILDKLGRCMYFTTLDLASGFHQIEMDPAHIPKTAFTVEGGHYEYLRMPFGLKNAPSTFQRVMDNVLKELVGKICLVYLDDIIIYSTSLQEHIESIKTVFDRLRSSNLKIQMDKCEFLRHEIAFLGHIITPEGTKPNPNKIQAIKNFPLPRTNKEIKSFLGLINYYRKFIKDLAKITKPLTNRLKKGADQTIDQTFIEAFETCKNLLTNNPILVHPDFSKPFIVTTDASNYAIGAVLSQGRVGSDKPISFASRTLSSSECNYSTIEKELLAIVWATKYFRPYLFGRKFLIVTDHKPLMWLMSLKEPNSKLVRWRLKLAEFEFEIVYKKGKANTNADALSRIKLINPDGTYHEIFNNDEDLQTVHSAQENLNDGIPISEKPLNEFNLQVILEMNDKGSPMTVETIFKNRQRRTIRRTTYDENIMIDILKKFFPHRKQTAVYTTDEIFSILQTTFSKYFSQNKSLRLLRCTEILKDIRKPDEQEHVIRDYHNRSNHRGINETLLHLKREYYFPHMKEKIEKTLNFCDHCKKLKYDRNPPKIKYVQPENPLKPLEIIHLDIYTINKNQILTIIDKFSRFAWGFPLNCRESVAILKQFKTFISLYGIPKKIICDQGSEFIANIFQDYCKQHEITLHFTSFQQTSSNSIVERLHSTLTEIYRIIYTKRIEEKLKVDHEEILSETLITYNNAIHSVTKLTPYELFFGRPYKFLKTLKFSNEHEYLLKLNEFIDNIYPKIKEKVDTITKNRTEKLNDNRETPEDLEVEDTIFRKECRRNNSSGASVTHF